MMRGFVSVFSRVIYPTLKMGRNDVPARGIRGQVGRSRRRTGRMVRKRAQ